MHPGAGDYDETLVNALIHYDSKNLSNIGEELRPGVVHRIDKDTSGLVVVAKNNLSHEKLDLLKELYFQQLDKFRKNPNLAYEIFRSGEKPRDRSLNRYKTAAMAMVANTLLNHDEVYMKR